MSNSPKKNRKPPASRILNAAVALFARKGFAGTTTRMIAAKARMNEALIFRHFPTKRHLYSAIIQRKIAEDPILAGVGTAQMAGEDDEAVLRLLAARVLDTVKSDPNFVRLLYFSGLEGHELSTMFFDCYARRVNEFLAARIKRGIARGRFRKVNTTLAARAFIGMLGHYALTSEVFGRAERNVTDAKIIETFVAIFLRGICA